jgi:HD-GYP domain-containing protein (c-di-GMP phosphodiesterase class II)
MEDTMRIAHVSDSLIGKVLASPVFGTDGRVLLSAGTCLQRRYILALRARGYDYVNIEDSMFKDVGSGDALSDATRIKATTVVRSTLNEISRGEDFDFEPVSMVVEDIMEDVQSSKAVLVSLSAVRSFDDYTFVHSVNVCVLSILIGRGLFLNRYDIKKLATGALLHDIGKITLPPEIINKPGKLTSEEYGIVKTHPMKGYEMMAQKTSLVSAHVALQHHERLDGTGYPRNMTADNIHEFGKVAAIADVYDALTSHRPYRVAYTPDEALRILLDPKSSVDQDLLLLLRARLALFSDGLIVRLADNRIGLVVKQTDDSARPVVRIVSDQSQQLVDSEDVDLRDNAHLRIDSILPDYPQELAAQLEKSYGMNYDAALGGSDGS